MLSKYSSFAVCEKTRHIYKIIKYGVKLFIKNYGGKQLNYGCEFHKDSGFDKRELYKQHRRNYEKVKQKLKEKIDEIINKIKIFIDEVKNIVDFDGINNLKKLLRKEYHNEYCIYKFNHKFEEAAELYVYISNYYNVYYETKFENDKIYYLDDNRNPIRGKINIYIKTDNDIVLDNESIDLIKKYQIKKNDFIKKHKINKFKMIVDEESIYNIKKYGINVVLQFNILQYNRYDLLLEQERLNEKLESSNEIINILQNRIELLEKKVFRKSRKTLNN
jgi:DNA-directed RNA polymerase subunit L